MIISNELYNEIISIIQNHKGCSTHLESSLSLQYGLSKNAVSSIISNEYKRKIKKIHFRVNSMISKLFERYKSLKKSTKESGILLKMAEEIDVSPTLLAKAVLDKYNEDNGSLNNISKCSNVKQYLKDSTLIEDKDLAYEVFLCQLYDNQYGSINDIIRHSLGQEYEYHLQNIIKEKKLSFQNEDDLRIYGYDKTPDIKLDVPFAVDGFIVNWIESKALFGDPEEHKNYIKDQYSSYWNRFGTGLVIYWLGAVESIMDPFEKRFIIRDEFPKSITITDPFIIAKIPSEANLNLQHVSE